MYRLFIFLGPHPPPPPGPLKKMSGVCDAHEPCPYFLFSISPNNSQVLVRLFKWNCYRFVFFR